jgi:excisionase family DNA binding protein
MPRTLSLDQAAELMLTSAETVSDCIHNRGLPAARVGRAFVLIDDDVFAWLRTQYGKWRENNACGSISAANEARGGLTSATSPASALDAALAPRTTKRRRSTPPRLRAISGALDASAKPRG